MTKLRNRKIDNTYVFKSFTELLNEVQLTTLRRDGTHATLPDDQQASFFGEALMKWKDLNCTQHFANFLHEMRGEVDSLLLVIHNQEMIASCLEKHLQVPNSMAYEPLLDLSVQLSKDLQVDFYKKYFTTFFHIFMRLLNQHHHDVELLTKVFVTLSYILKSLLKHFLKDIDQIFDLFSPLLSTQHYRVYINRFAAEVFSFLLRKHPNVGSVVEMMLRKVINNPNLATGTSQLLFETVRGIKYQFHSCTTQIMSTLLNLLDKKDLCIDVVFECLLNAWNLMLQHTNKMFVKAIIIQPLDKLNALLNLHTGSEVKPEQVNIEEHTFMLKLLLTFAHFKNGHLFHEHAVSVAQVVERIFQCKDNTTLKSTYERVLYDLCSICLLSNNADVSTFHRPRLLKMAYSHESVSFRTISKFSRDIYKLPLYEKDALVHFMKFCDNTFATSATKSIELLASLICDKYNGDVHLAGNNLKFPKLWNDYILNTTKRISSSLATTINGESASQPTLTTSELTPQTLSSSSASATSITTLSSLLSSLSLTLHDLWALTLCIPFARFENDDEEDLAKHLMLFVEHLMTAAFNIDCQKLKKQYLFLLKQTIHSLIHIVNRIHDKNKDIYESVFKHSDQFGSLINEDDEDGDYKDHETCNKESLDGGGGGGDGGGDDRGDGDDDDGDNKLLDVADEDKGMKHIEIFLTRLLQLFSDEEMILESVLECLDELNGVGGLLAGRSLFSLWLQVLEDNLVSPYSQLRLVTLKLLCKFDVSTWIHIKESLDDNDLRNVFEICLEAEQTPADLHHYRHKLSCLQKLGFDHLTNKLPSICSITMPLKYLIGQLFVNFDLITKPISSLVASYATNLKLDVFWSVFGPLVIYAQHQAASSHERDNIDDDDDDDDDDEEDLNDDVVHMETDDNTSLHEPSSSSSPQPSSSSPSSSSPSTNRLYISELFLNLCHSPDEMRKLDRPNFSTFRERLWSCMLLFSGTCEPRSRIIVPVFFKFLEDEYRYNWDNPKYKRPMSIHDEMKSKVPDRLLVMHLKLFALFNQPKNLFQEQKLYDLYLELMKQSSLEVQKVAFRCFMTYKPSYLIPYKENFERLLDEKTFKDEIVLFSFEDGVSMVKWEHREGVVPILMRILLGKMRQRLGSDANGRSVGQSRKNIVMTFLASFSRDEIVVLLDLIFDPVMQFADGDVETNVSDILMNRLDLGVPLKKLQSLLTSVEMIFKKLGNKLDDFLVKIFNILVCIGAFCNNKLRVEKRSQHVPKVINMLKNIRSSVISLIIEFFELFESYNFKASDVEALFNSIIWPQLDKLPQDSIVNPSALMKIFLCWSQNPRYHCLLIKLKKPTEAANDHSMELQSATLPPSSSSSLPLPPSPPPSSSSSLPHPSSLSPPSSPLSTLLHLLNLPNVDHTVTNIILTIIDNLLTISYSYNDDEEEEEEDVCKGLPIVPGNVVDIITPDYDGGGGAEALSYGTNIVVHFCFQILSFIECKIKSGSMKSKNKKQNAPTRELSILSKLSQFVRDANESERVVQQLMTMMSMRVCRLSSDNEIEMLISIKHLLVNHSTNIKPLAKSLALLFSSTSNIQCRNELCSILQVLSEKLPSLKVIADIIKKLNSTDPKKLNEPDYMVRMEAYIEATNYLIQRGVQHSNNGTPVNDVICGDNDGKTHLHGCDDDYDDILMLLYNCLFFISTSDDRALRDRSMSCIEGIIKFSSGHHGYHVIVNRHLLPAIKKNLKLKVEVHRHCYISLLAMLIRHFQANAQMQSLNVLRDYEDEEKDFFLNIIHFQTHRRGKALRRLSQHFKSLADESSETTTKVIISSKTLVSYILPIILSFLKDESYGKDADLLDGAVDALASVVRFLPWENYFGVLRHYLKVLDKAPPNQKLVVRLIVALLESFHFDLSKSRFTFNNNKGDSNLVEKDEDNAKKDVVNDAIDVEDDVNDDDNDNDDGHEKDDEKKKTDDIEVDVDDDDDMDCDDKRVADVSDLTEVNKVETFKGWTLCDPTKATHIHKTMMNQILPTLHKCLTHKAKSDDQHKLAQPGKYAEDEEILRVPIALAMVKLLKGLPSGSLERNIQSIIVKLCFFLGSRAEDIRNITRDTLKKVLLTLGAQYVHMVFREMKSHLHRGYQLHVLSFSIWSLLNEMHTQTREDRKEGKKEFLHPGDLDACTPLLNEVFHKELFGDVSEEKEVDAIARKLFEAKTTKSFDAYKLLSTYISVNCLPKIVMPLKDVLCETRSHKVVNKVTESLNKISQGLLDNQSLATNIDFVLAFIYALTSESLENFVNKSSNAENKMEKPDTRLQPVSCLLLPAQPLRGGSKPKSDVKANLYVFVEFGLNLLHLLLKHSHLDEKEHTHLEAIDPFVAILSKSLLSKHTKVCTSSLKCLTWLLRLPLPSLRTNINTIVNQLFILFKNYAAVGGGGRNEHADMVDWCFKVIRVVVQFVLYHNITEEQLHVLLSYAEQDLHDYTKHSTAFPLLHAILCRKLDAKELGHIMETVEQMMIKSDTSDVQSKCRKVIMTYLLDYPLKTKTMEQHLKFFTKQFEYDYESGRLAALELINNIINVFPKYLVNQHASLIFVQLAQARLNDESSKCITMVSDTIKLLIDKVDADVRDKLRTVTFQWLQSSKKNVLMLSSIMLSLFIEVEKTNFNRHFNFFLPIFNKLIDPQHFQETILSDVEQLEMDRLLFHHLNLLLNITSYCDVLKDCKYFHHINPIWVNLEKHLRYDYEPVRLKAAQLFNRLLTSAPLDDVIESLSSSSSSSSSTSSLSTSSLKKRKKKRKELKRNDEEEDDVDKHFLLTNSRMKLYTLMGSLTYQLSSPTISLELATEATKNLLCIAQIIIRFNDVNDDDGDDDDDDEKSTERQKNSNKKFDHKSSSEKNNGVDDDNEDVDNNDDDNDIDDDDDDDDDDNDDDDDGDDNNDGNCKYGLSLSWLIRRVCRETRLEVTNNRQSTIKRNSVFVWLGALCKELGPTRIQKYLYPIMKPLVREVLDNSTDADPSLKTLCQEVLELIETICGSELYSRSYATLHNQISAKKSSVKAAKVQQATTNPEVFAKRKIKKNVAKKEAKKRKIGEMKPGSQPWKKGKIRK